MKIWILVRWSYEEGAALSCLGFYYTESDALLAQAEHEGSAVIEARLAA